jgi:hypothetical protein
MTDGSDEELPARNMPTRNMIARDMIDVHGVAAAAIARENARGAALAGQPAQAKSWIGVLGLIQRQQAGRPWRSGGSGDPSPASSAADAAEG